MQASPSPIEDEELPTNLQDAQNLPTSLVPQAPDLPSSRFQSIVERYEGSLLALNGRVDKLQSGVLAASVEKSKQKWLSNGPFEKFWTKPSKKKNLGDIQNPTKESMLKLGACSMIIKPHVFEVTLFSIKSSQYMFLPPVGQIPISQASASPRTSTGGPPQLSASPSGNLNREIPSLHPGTPQGPHLPSRPSPKTAANGKSNQGSPNAPSRQNPSPVDGNSTDQVVRPGPPHSPVKPAKETTDPVIQLLAERAASDSDLKSLMKLVAQGLASPPQLKTFQAHIDEINTIIKSRPKPTSAAGSSERTLSQPLAPSQTHARPTQTPDILPQPMYQPSPIAPPSYPRHEPVSQLYSQPPSYVKPRGSAAAKQEISGVVFDFNGGNGDRYLLPRDSIIEYLPGGTQVLISFLVTRKGSEADGARFKSNVDYYQPITIRLSSHHAKVLEPISRVVKHPEEVRRSMTDIMSRMTLAEDVHLVTRLPRAADGEKPEEPVAEEVSEDTVLESYDAPNSLLPLR